jgi:hypothetical protein
MLRRLFGPNSLPPETRTQVLAYLKREIDLNGRQDDEAGRFNQVMTMHGSGLLPGSDSAKAVAAAASTMAKVDREIVAQHSQISPIPDEAGPCYMAWHATYSALADWADMAAAVYIGTAEGSLPSIARAQQLLVEEERRRKEALKQQGALMKRIKLTAEEGRQLFAR